MFTVIFFYCISKWWYSLKNSYIYITFTIVTLLLHTLNAGGVIGYKEIKVEAGRPLNDYKSPSKKI